jgi:hypothetical protein
MAYPGRLQSFCLADSRSRSLHPARLLIPRQSKPITTAKNISTRCLIGSVTGCRVTGTCTVDGPTGVALRLYQVLVRAMIALAEEAFFMHTS